MDAAARTIETFTPRRLVSAFDEDAEIEPGAPCHAVLNDGRQRGPAICGTTPTKKTAWNIHSGITVSCERCQRLLAGERP